MTTLYTMAINAIMEVLGQIAQKKPATGAILQQALLKVEIALDNASTMPTAPADKVAQLLHLREQLLTAQKYSYHAQSCQY
ncbi:hypothetical protein [uncultured Duncaniella sp.]|uniref:hypothetical protein n=1 Tax=uncultured Duncaniella sp. TaxID=2768039 RepID=UPI002658402C|nr:hypothetical protein [uncultured Duncaniella sp.]